VRPLRQPRTGNTHTTPHKPKPQTGPSSPSRISRRWPASSSFVLAAARLRALQLDSSRAAADRAAARKIQENSQPDDSTLVTGPGLYALLTVVALMGAADRVCLRFSVLSLIG
jgi:hypothetical protein